MRTFHVPKKTSILEINREGFLKILCQRLLKNVDKQIYFPNLKIKIDKQVLCQRPTQQGPEEHKITTYHNLLQDIHKKNKKTKKTKKGQENQNRPFAAVWTSRGLGEVTDNGGN